jgi:hypothetical protein
MKPFDQINRDWSKGNCFYVSLEFMKDSERLRACGSIPDVATVRLVHGLLDAGGQSVKHAWIEIDDLVLDHSNNNAIKSKLEDYYSNSRALPRRRFSRDEADALLGTLQPQGAPLPIGYWGDLTDDDVASAMAGYQEASGIFASGACFSDPSDSANAYKLQIKDASSFH